MLLFLKREITTTRLEEGVCCSEQLPDAETRGVLLSFRASMRNSDALRGTKRQAVAVPP
jgi:hypothetical protein